MRIRQEGVNEWLDINVINSTLKKQVKIRLFLWNEDYYSPDKKISYQVVSFRLKNLET